MAKKYVLVTPAKNEQDYIQKTIDAVVRQTWRPGKWVIVNDGSVDGTGEILGRAAAEHDFIEIISAQDSGQRNFGSKARAFQAGYAKLAGHAHEFVGNLDADASFSANYYEEILKRFEANPTLGIAGGLVAELIDDQFVPQRMSMNSVAGAVQLFRRECFEAIGGYPAIAAGGIDAAAEITARARGWVVQTFPELQVLHHRRVVTGTQSIPRHRFQAGVSDYQLGYHPFFEIARALGRIMDRPVVVGSVMMLVGYAWAWSRKLEKSIPADTIKFLRSEQVSRLIKPLRRY